MSSLSVASSHSNLSTQVSSHTSGRSIRSRLDESSCSASSSSVCSRSKKTAGIRTIKVSLEEEDALNVAPFSRKKHSCKVNANRKSVSRKVRVAVRCRPALPRTEPETYCGRVESAVCIPGQAVVEVKSGRDKKQFSFDYAFGPECKQADIYGTIASPIVSDVLKGKSGAIIAYGQTGTGKSYTMGILERTSITNASREEIGIIPSSLAQIFDSLEEGKDKVKISFLQIYLETLYDLLAPLDGGSVDEALSMREDPTNGFFVQGLREYTAPSFRAAMALINLGLESRKTACTNMNTTSSRSHTLLTIKLERGGQGAQQSCLHLVDLAGSERTSINADQRSERFMEARAINTSLSALGNVVAALACPGIASHVPYRDSKLTRLLQRTLDSRSDANTALIATVGPGYQSSRESLSTLKFASRCMRVKRLEELPKPKTRGEESEYKAQLLRKIYQLQTEQDSLIRIHHQELEEAKSCKLDEDKLLADLAYVAKQNRDAFASFVVNSPGPLRTEEELVRIIRERCAEPLEPIDPVKTLRQDCSLFRSILEVRQSESRGANGQRRKSPHRPGNTEESWSFVLKYLLDSNEKLRRESRASS